MQGQKDKPLPFELDFAASPGDMRRALDRISLALVAAGLGAARLSRVELVLAEVLNNIAEHAYAGQPAGRVRLRVAPDGDCLRTVIRDRGRPMPGGNPPKAALPDMDVPRDALPEGGFGWYLIHTQADALEYRREGGENRLELRFAPRPGR